MPTTFLFRNVNGPKPFRSSHCFLVNKIGEGPVLRSFSYVKQSWDFFPLFGNSDRPGLPSAGQKIPVHGAYNFLLQAAREFDYGVGGGLLLCIMSRTWPHPCSITWRLPGSLFSKQLPASFCACHVRRLVRPRRWSELSSPWCAVFDKIWVLHTPARFARGRSSFTLYSWSFPA